MSFQSMPLLRIVLAFGLGIIFQHYRPFQTYELLAVFVLSFTGAILINRYASARFNILFGFLSLLSFVTIGALYLKVHKGELDDENLKEINLSQCTSFKAIITEAPIRKTNSYQLRFKVYELESEYSAIQVKGKLQAYADSLKASELKVGDILWIKGRPELISQSKNPHVFDYKEYLAFQNIHFQNFIGKNFHVIGHKKEAYWSVLISTLREKAEHQFDLYLKEDQANQVAKALVLGQRQGLDDDLLKNYAASGAIHVLAVSGLHVGLIYLILMTLLQRIPFPSKHRKWSITLICISILFVYALLTGLSPSVFRAFVMFSFFAIAKAIKRKTNSYNVLAASALVLLLVDPYLLMSVGFQLSYLAVIGIIYIQPKLYGLFSFNWILLDKVWALSCVSISAQLATAPLSMLYFHQFPSYFLVSNLFIIPAAFVILLLGLTLLALSFSPLIAGFLGVLLEKVIQWTNILVDQVSQWPHGVITNIQLSVLETWAIYALISSLILFLVKKKIQWLIFGLGCASIFCFSQIKSRSELIDSSEISVYQIPNHQAIELRTGTKNLLLLDSTLKTDAESIEFHILPNQRFHHIDGNIEVPSIEKGENQILVFNALKVLVPNYKLNWNTDLSNVHWDLIISSNPRHFEILKAEEFVLNSSRKLTSELNSDSVYLLNERGYYSKKWR